MGWSAASMQGGAPDIPILHVECIIHFPVLGPMKEIMDEYTLSRYTLEARDHNKRLGVQRMLCLVRGPPICPFVGSGRRPVMTYHLQVKLEIQIQTIINLIEMY